MIPSLQPNRKMQWLREPRIFLCSWFCPQFASIRVRKNRWLSGQSSALLLHIWLAEAQLCFWDLFRSHTILEHKFPFGAKSRYTFQKSPLWTYNLPDNLRLLSPKRMSRLWWKRDMKHNHQVVPSTTHWRWSRRLNQIWANPKWVYSQQRHMKGCPSWDPLLAQRD